MVTDTMQALDIVRIILTLSFLIIASRSDWKTRTAEDWTWIVMGAVGITMIAYTLSQIGWRMAHGFGILLLILVFADIFMDRKPLYDSETRKIGFTGLAMTLLGILLLLAFISDATSNMALGEAALILGPLIMIYFYYLLYMLNVVHGGADAKALMSLAVLFPVYPVLGSFPIYYPGPPGEIFFPFSFLILFFSALVTLAVPVTLLVYNLSKGNTGFPQAILGYKKDISKDPEFSWPMEIVKEGRIVFRFRPEKGMDVHQQFQALRQEGRTEAWVTPKIPFIIPMLCGFILALVFGNPLFALM